MADQVMGEFREPASWPKVVGTISIVWGSLGLLCVTCMGVGALMPSIMLNMVPEDKRAEVQQRMAANAPWPIEYVLMGLGCLMAILLLVSGIMLVKRNAGARPLFLTYGVVGALLALTHAGVAFTKVPASIKAGMPPGTKEDMVRMATMFAYGTAALGVLLGLAWPVFCLIWFGLVKRDTRDLDGGPEPAV